MRSHAVYCSNRCRTRASRGREKALQDDLVLAALEAEIDPEILLRLSRTSPLRGPPGVKGVGAGSASSRSRRRASALFLRRRLASLYCRALGLDGTRGYQRSWKDRFGWRQFGQLRLNTATYERPGEHALASGLFGKQYGVHPWGVRTTRVVTLDLDVRLGREEEAEVYGEVKSAGISRAEARRRAVARKIWPLVEDLGDAFGDAAIVETSDGGAHVSFLLARTVPVSRATEAGARILERVGRRAGPQDEGFVVEVFPKAGEDSRGCRLPLTGGARLLGRTLAELARPRNAGRPRELDVQEMLLAPRLGLAELGVHERAGEEPEGAPGAPSGDGGAFPVRAAAVSAVLGELDDARVRELVGVRLEGRAFASVCSYLVRSGIPDDASFGAVGKLAALAVYGGLSERAACRAFEALAGRGGHRSTRCQSRRGRLALAGTFRSFFRRGLAAPGVRPGALRNPALLAVLREMGAERRAA